MACHSGTVISRKRARMRSNFEFLKDTFVFMALSMITFNTNGRLAQLVRAPR